MQEIEELGLEEHEPSSPEMPEKGTSSAVPLIQAVLCLLFLAVLLALLSLGVKNIYLGPTLPAFLSPNVLQYMTDTFGLRPISNAEDDIKSCLKQNI